MRNPIAWIVELFKVVKDFSILASEVRRQGFQIDRQEYALRALQNRVFAQSSRMDALDKLIRERTEIAVDAAVVPQDTSYVITVGKYRNADYVQVFSIQGGEFYALVEQLKALRRHGVLKYADGPVLIKAAVERPATWGSHE